MSEYRRKAAATHREIDAELARQKAVRDESYRAARVAELADKAVEGSVTRESFPIVLGAVFIRDQFGWRRVLKVNARSVTVPSLLKEGWSDTVRFEKIREVRA